MRAAFRAAATAALFAALVLFFLARLFPADVVARALFARLPAGSPAVVFRTARLGARGFELADVTLRGPDGGALLDVPRIVFRPSLHGLWSGPGLPWRIAGTVCGGDADVVVTGERSPSALTLGWHDVDLGTCPPLALTGSALAGRAALAARLAFEPMPDGAGTVEVRDAAWHDDRGGMAGLLGGLHAERAVVRWRLVDGRLELTALELHGPEVSAKGGGRVHLAAPLATSALDLRLAISAAPGAPDRVRALLALLPGDTPDAPRLITVGGTVERPDVVAGP